MTFPVTVPETLKFAKLYHGAANAVACDVVDTTGLHMLWFQIVHSGAADTDLTLTLYEATDVAAGTNAAITTVCPIWVDLDAGASSDVISATTAAYSYTIDTGNYPNQMVFIQVDPAILSDGYPCVYLSAADGNASNNVLIQAIGVPRFKGATLDAIIS